MFVLLKWKLLVMRRSVYKWSVFFIVFIMIFLISESALESLEAWSSYSGHSKWFAPTCEGATFAWSLTTTRLSRTWNLFLLDERKSNRGVRLRRRSSQLKIKLISNTRKGYYRNQFLLKRWQANFNLQFVYSALKYASQLGFVIGDTWKWSNLEYYTERHYIPISHVSQGQTGDMRLF